MLFIQVYNCMSDSKEHFFSSFAETGVYLIYSALPWQQNLFSMRFLVSVLPLLIPSPEVINLCLGHQNPSPQQLVLILKTLQVKKVSQWKDYNFCWQTFFPRY